MSDFDKEAEREKLREKYGDEAKQRETTQQMSELLLQGATMTNRHCDECGDPIFRHEGQEFCPTCQSAGNGGGQETPDEAGPRVESDGEAATAESAGNRDGQASQKPRDAVRPKTGNRDHPRDDEEATESVDGTPTTAPAGTPPSRGDGQAGRAGGRERSGPESGSRVPRESGGDLASAEASLVRTLERFARQAEETEDPRAAKEHLAAAREAAEALRALRR
jgi:uncharacterized Zn finger protein (UPF0148 family)